MLTNRCLVDVLLPLTLKLVRKPFCILHNVTTMSGSSQSPIVQTDLHRSMALQEERLRQVETMTNSLATNVQEIQEHLTSAMPLPPSYEEIEGEVLL